MAEFIVAIEIGSSKITGIAGKKNTDGSITVLAVVTEDSTSFIRKGVVYNIDKTAACLTNIINRLKTLLKADITQVFVGVGGQSIRSVKNVIVKNLPQDSVISQEMIFRLMDTNRAVDYPEHETIHAATQEYKVDSQYQIDPVGIRCNRLEGDFLNVLSRKNFYMNLNKCFEQADINIAEMYLSPLALAESILTENDMRSGCMLVDLGAETTTVSVFYKSILRHMAVIPLGGNNITKDIASLQMDEKEAEKMKLKYASAYTDSKNIDETLTYSIDPERRVESSKFIEIVEARVEEIIKNVLFQVPNEYADKLMGGIILTGGGANMPNIDKAFRKFTNIEKIRIANFVNKKIESKEAIINDHNCMMNTALALLAKGDLNCAGEELTEGIISHPLGTNNTDQDPNQKNGKGVVLTQADKDRIEAERKKKEMEEQAERERLKREQEAEEEERLRLKRENSMGHKLWKKMKAFGRQMIDEDD